MMILIYIPKFSLKYFSFIIITVSASKQVRNPTFALIVLFFVQESTTDYATGDVQKFKKTFSPLTSPYKFT